MKPNRSVISVPGHIEKMHHKALSGDADVVMFDLEDSVPVNNKAEARDIVSKTLSNNKFNGKRITVRVNSPHTPLCLRDILALQAHIERIDSIVVPKVNTPGDIHFIKGLLESLESEAGCRTRAGIEVLIESAEAMKNIFHIASCCSRIKSLVFGIADYSASIGARLVSISGHGEGEDEIYPGHRWNFAMSRIVLAAKSHGLLAIDAAYGNFRDPEGLEKSARTAAALGMDGKWIIHPAQAETVNRIFSPSEEEIERAAIIVSAAEEAESRGLGAVSINGRMVDAATVSMAEKVLELAEQIRHLETGLEKLSE